MKSKWLFLMLIVPFMLTMVGCGTLAVPKMVNDKMSITLPDGKVLDIDGNKDKSLTGLEYTVDPATGISTLKIASYSSSANAAALAEAGNTARQQMMLTNMLGSFIGQQARTIENMARTSYGIPPRVDNPTATPVPENTQPSE